MSDWGDIIGDLAGIALGAAVIGGVGYFAAKNMDNAITQLLNTPIEETIGILVDAIPRMESTDWNLFLGKLSDRAEYNEAAQVLLGFAICVREAMKEIEQLLSYSSQEAFSIIIDLFPQKDEIEQVAFFGTLHTYATENVKAKAVFGKLQAALE